MLFRFTDEQEKYLIPVLGNGWNCVVKTTPPEIVKTFKEFNKFCNETFGEPEVIHFISAAQSPKAENPKANTRFTPTKKATKKDPKNEKEIPIHKERF